MNNDTIIKEMICTFDKLESTNDLQNKSVEDAILEQIALHIQNTNTDVFVIGMNDFIPKDYIQNLSYEFVKNFVALLEREQLKVINLDNRTHTRFKNAKFVCSRNEKATKEYYKKVGFYSDKELYGNAIISDNKQVMFNQYVKFNSQINHNCVFDMLNYEPKIDTDVFEPALQTFSVTKAIILNKTELKNRYYSVIKREILSQIKNGTNITDFNSSFKLENDEQIIKLAKRLWYIINE